MLEFNVSGELTQVANPEIFPASSAALVIPLQQEGGIVACPFVLFLFAIVLSVLLRYTDSD
jgi:hypothetical protein